MSISEKGESSQANDQKPIREFTQEELKIIDKQVTKYLQEAQKLKEEAERRSRHSCIYRVLPRLKEINGNSLYEPNMVSIGPYYYNLRNKKFKMAEDCKKMCFGSLLVRNRSDPNMQTDTYKRCLQKISELELDIRKCYSEEFEVAGIEFLEMMVLDACFIIEIIEMFRRFDESFEALGWMVPYFSRDFLLLENQIPFFVLEAIYALTHDDEDTRSRSSLIRTALTFFNYVAVDELNIRGMDMPAPVMHLLDLVRSSFTMPLRKSSNRWSSYEEIPSIHCVSKLQQAGIKVSRPVKKRSFLDVRFKKGVIEMPNIAIDDFMRCLLLNCVAFEQCHGHNLLGDYFTAYAAFLDDLVNTTEDVEYLLERNVIDNYVTEDSELAGFINRAGKDLSLNAPNEFHLLELYQDVSKHYENRWKWKRASFEKEYFDKPWYLLSAAGGILLVLATSIQAVMAILTYKYKNC